LFLNFNSIPLQSLWFDTLNIALSYGIRSIASGNLLLIFWSTKYHISSYAKPTNCKHICTLASSKAIQNYLNFQESNQNCLNFLESNPLHSQLHSQKKRDRLQRISILCFAPLKRHLIEKERNSF
jgi:hypothetical protein